MLAFWINYGSNEHITGDAQYIIPLIMQALPAVLLFGSMWFCHESPRWLARQDRWEEASKILSLVRGLPATHPYVAGELTEIRDQLDHERSLIGDAGFKDVDNPRQQEARTHLRRLDDLPADDRYKRNVSRSAKTATMNQG
jgi:hypothetical protein